MTIEEYIKLNYKIQTQFMQNLLPAIELNSKITQAVGPIIAAQARLSQTYKPLYDLQNQISGSVHKFTLMFEEYRKINISLGQPYASYIQRQEDITNNLPSCDIDISSSELSNESSITIRENAVSAIKEFEACVLPEEVTESKQAILQLTEPKKSLTWEQVLLIISFIITLLTFFQDQLPDKDAEATISALHEIIEIQSKELDLLNQRIHE